MDVRPDVLCGDDNCVAYEYAGQFTSHYERTLHGCTTLVDLYFGWIGIDGQIQTPSALVGHPAINYGWHYAGWLGVAFSGSNGGMQVGFVNGYIYGCNTGGVVCSSVDSPNAYVEYFEEITPPDPTGYQSYTVFSPRGLNASEAVTYRVDKDSGGCWHPFDFYNHSIIDPDCYLPSSGAMEVTAEATDPLHNGGTEMATAYFGD